MGYPYTYGDELSDNEAKSNLGKLGKIVAPFILVWCFKTCMAIAIDIPESKVQPIEQQPAAPSPSGVETPGHLNGRPPAHSKPMFGPYIPPAECVTSNPVFVAVGAIVVVYTCAAAFITNDKRLYAACIGWLTYIAGGK